MIKSQHWLAWAAMCAAVGCGQSDRSELSELEAAISAPICESGAACNPLLLGDDVSDSRGADALSTADVCNDIELSFSSPTALGHNLDNWSEDVDWYFFRGVFGVLYQLNVVARPGSGNLDVAAELFRNSMDSSGHLVTCEPAPRLWCTDISPPINLNCRIPEDPAHPEFGATPGMLYFLRVHKQKPSTGTGIYDVTLSWRDDTTCGHQNCPCDPIQSICL